MIVFQIAETYIFPRKMDGFGELDSEAEKWKTWKNNMKTLEIWKINHMEKHIQNMEPLEKKNKQIIEILQGLVLCWVAHKKKQT